MYLQLQMLQSLVDLPLHNVIALSTTKIEFLTKTKIAKEVF